MVKRSHGPRRGTRSPLTKRVRERGKVPIRRFVQEFKKGESVIINPEPSVQKGMPHRRFFWKKAKVVEKKGKAYVLEVKDGKAAKKVITLPVHLRK